MKLSGHDSNSFDPRMMLPAVLFPDPDRPSSTRRSSGDDEVNEVDEGIAEGEKATVGEEEEEEKTGD